MLAGELGDVRERRRVLLAPGGGFDTLLRAAADGTGLRCWLLTGTGRMIAGASGLPRAAAVRLAAGYQAAPRPGGPESPVIVDGGDGGPHTLLPVGSDAHGLTGWFLACAGAESGWDPRAAKALADLEADAVVERARLAARVSGERGLAEAVIGRLAGDTLGGTADGAEAEALLRAAGLRPPFLAVSLTVSPDGGRDLAEELLGGYAGRAVVAPAGDEVLAVLSGAGDGMGAGTADLARWLRDAGPALRAAGTELTAGLSGPVPSAPGLPGALREASAAQRAAAQRAAGKHAVFGGEDPVRIATSADVDSHELLLASVPATVLRSFRDRLLGPLAEYDARHKAELLPTLRSFLACDGSWSACATRMYVHVNTVRYRIGRIEALTGRNLSALPDRVDFFLALRDA